MAAVAQRLAALAVEGRPGFAESLALAREVQSER